MTVTRRYRWWMMGLVCGIIVLVGPSLGWAREKKPAPPPPPVKADPRVQEAQSRLNGTEWAIQVIPLSGTQPKHPTADTLRFEKDKVSSKQLGDSGFPSTSYTITVGDDGVVVWETMQTSGDTSVVFWRGEVHGETMRGIVSKHPANGEVADMAFSGKFSGPIAPPEPPPAETSSTQAPEASAAVVPVETSRDKKK